jgi:cytochrome c oxidase assembly protein subunit 15
MVVLMILVGGITRLTESGLSMVTWNPVTGWVPPLSHTAWEEAFVAYQATPEYQHINRGMSLSEFQSIYWWEFIHRVLGRLTGLIVAVPVLILWLRRLVPSEELRRLAVLPLLVGLQGYMGWYMVKSGLVDRTDVSPYRLMMHLSLALVLLGLIVRAWAKLRWPKIMSSTYHPWPQSLLILFVMYIPTMMMGALVAGLNGGMVYNTFPLMNGHWIPPEVTAAPLFFEDPAAVQWLHRVLAFGFFGAALVYSIREKRWELLCLVLLQVVLGAITVLGQVPLWAASWHQVNAAFILIMLVVGLYAQPKEAARTSPSAR